MASARSLPADFFIPEVATEFAFSAFTEKLLLFQAAMTGAAGSPITIVPPGNLTEEGERVVMPFYKRIAAFVTRRDLTTITAPDDLKLDGDTKGMVVIRQKIGPVAFSRDSVIVTRANEAGITEEIGRQAGQEMAKTVQDSIFRIIFASLGITFQGVSHIKDAYEAFVANKSTNAVAKNTLALSLINRGKELLADFSDQLNTMIVRSELAHDMVEKNLATGFDSIGGYTALTGEILTLGLGRPLVMDNSLAKSVNPSGSRTGSGSGTGTASFDLFRTLLLGPGAGMLVFPHNLDLWMEGPKLDAESPYWRILGNFDFAFMLRGASYKAGSPANPTAAQQADSTNYEDKTTAGHKEILAMAIESNRDADAT